MIRAVPQVEVVMVLAKGEEVFGTDTLVQFHQFVGVPVFCFPVTAKFFQSIFVGRTIDPLVVSALPMVFIIHVAGIPVAGFGLTLWPPVCPDAEFGIFEPFGAFPLFQTLPIRLEVTLRDGHIGCARCGYPRDSAA